MISSDSNRWEFPGIINTKLTLSNIYEKEKESFQHPKINERKRKQPIVIKMKSNQLHWAQGVFLDASINFYYLLSFIYVFNYTHLDKLFQQTAQVKEFGRPVGLSTEGPHPGGRRVQTFSPARDIVCHKSLTENVQNV